MALSPIASDDDDDTGQRETEADREIIKEAQKRYDRCVEWESAARRNADFDIKFAEGDSLNNWQWDTGTVTARGDRPCLTDNQVRQFNLQIVNDARQNKAAIKITPTGDQATYEAAQVFTGIVRRIEYQSKAIDAYTTGIFHQVQSGIGYARVVTEYVDSEAFDRKQEIYVKRVGNPKAVYMDPDAKEYDKSDMRFAFVFQDVPRDLYEEEHGEGADMAPATLGDLGNPWSTRDHVRVAEYFRKIEEKDTLYLMNDGVVLKKSELPRGAYQSIKGSIVSQREIERPKIEWFLICGNRIKERKVWPGKYIPIVPFIGEETVIDGVMDRKGHTRSMISSQRMYNYWTSAAVEQVALQTKAPYIAPDRAIEGYETMWASANTKNWSVLTYKDIDDAGQPIAPPERTMPPTMADAYLKGIMMARENMMRVTGQYQASLGSPSNERSGIAIQERQRQGDNATYHFIDNQGKAIRQVGRIIVDLIPKIYDVEQVTKIMAEDGSDSEVRIDPAAPKAFQQVLPGPGGGMQPVSPDQAKVAEEDPDSPNPTIIFNPSVGMYDVEADVGPAFGTRRQEAFNAMSQIIQQNPQLVNIAGDLLFKSADFPLADELAERLKRGVPPQFMGGPPPAIQAAQQQLQQTQQQASALLAQADQEIKALKAQLKDKDKENETKEYEAETNRLKAVGTIDPMALQIIVRQLVEEMLETNLEPMLQRHAGIQSGLQSAPPGAAPNGMGMQPQPNGASIGGGMPPDVGMMRPSGGMA